MPNKDATDSEATHNSATALYTKLLEDPNYIVFGAAAYLVAKVTPPRVIR